MIKPPAGKKEFEIFSQNFSIEDVLKKSRKKCTLLKLFGRNGNAWMIVKNKKRVVAAYFYGEEELFGIHAIPGIQKLLKENCKITAYELNEQILPLFTGMYPQVAIDKDVSAAVFGARIKDEVSTSDKDKIKQEQFTEEWEEEQETPINSPKEEKDNMCIQEEVIESSEFSFEDHEENEIKATVSVSDGLVESIKNSLNSEEKPEETTPSESTAVINFHDFLMSLAEKKFSGIVKGYDETIEMTAYLVRGEIMAAMIKDENVVMKGNSALLYFDTPAKVIVESKTP